MTPSAISLANFDPPGVDGWTEDSLGWTYASATTFTVAGDQTLRYGKGTRLRFKQGGAYKYVVVVDVSHSSGTTTVTTTGGDDYSIANSAITDNAFSYQASPQGYPGLFSYTPSWTGFSANPTDVYARFAVVGKLCWVRLYAAPGTSSSAAFTVTLPVLPVGGGYWYPIKVYDNTAHPVNPGMAYITHASAAMDVYKDMQFGGWTASGSKGAHFAFEYEI